MSRMLERWWTKKVLEITNFLFAGFTYLYDIFGELSFNRFWEIFIFWLILDLCVLALHRVWSTLYIEPAVQRVGSWRARVDVNCLTITVNWKSLSTSRGGASWLLRGVRLRIFFTPPLAKSFTVMCRQNVYPFTVGTWRWEIFEIHQAGDALGFLRHASGFFTPHSLAYMGYLNW